jgi:hypothetical protein
VRIKVFSVSPDGRTSFLEQVLNFWLQDDDLQAVSSQFRSCQPILRVVVPHDGNEGRLLKPLAFRAYSIIHSHSPWPRLEFVGETSQCWGRKPDPLKPPCARRGIHSPPQSDHRRIIRRPQLAGI